MSENIEIVCPHCDHSTFKPLDTIKQYYGREIKFTCSNCRSNIPISVNARLVNKKRFDVKDLKTENFDKLQSHQSSDLKLKVVGNPGTTTESYLQISEGENIIGRFSASVQLPNYVPIQTADTSMSRKHAIVSKIILPNGNVRFSIRDNGSMNGLYVNQKSLVENEEIVLSQGDLIQLGITKILVE